MKYPLVVSVCGEPKAGKTTFAARFPNSFIIDFCAVSMGMAHAEVLKFSDVGESHFSIYKEFQRISKDADAEIAKRYRFVNNWKEFLDAIEAAKQFKKNLNDTEEKEGKKPSKVWLVIDDSYRWRVFAVLKWIELQFGKTRKASGKDITWPSKQEWGLVSQLMIDTLNTLKMDFNIILIHRMKDEYIRDVPTGNVIAQSYPSGIDSTGDALIEVAKEIDADGKRHRFLRIIFNRFDDDCAENPTTEIRDTMNPIEVLKKLNVPRAYI